MRITSSDTPRHPRNHLPARRIDLRRRGSLAVGLRNDVRWTITVAQRHTGLARCHPLSQSLCRRAVTALTAIRLVRIPAFARTVLPSGSRPPREPGTARRTEHPNALVHKHLSTRSVCYRIQFCLLSCAVNEDRIASSSKTVIQNLLMTWRSDSVQRIIDTRCPRCLVC